MSWGTLIKHSRERTQFWKERKGRHAFGEALQFSPYLWKAACPAPGLVTCLAFYFSCHLPGAQRPRPWSGGISLERRGKFLSHPPPSLLFFLSFTFVQWNSSCCILFRVNFGKHIWDLVFSGQDYGGWIFLNIQLLLHLNHVAKANIPSDKTYPDHTLCDTTGEEAQFTCGVVSPKIHNPI